MSDFVSLDAESLTRMAEVEQQLQDLMGQVWSVTVLSCLRHVAEVAELADCFEIAHVTSCDSCSGSLDWTLLGLVLSSRSLPLPQGCRIRSNRNSNPKLLSLCVETAVEHWSVTSDAPGSLLVENSRALICIPVLNQINKVLTRGIATAI